MLRYGYLYLRVYLFRRKKKLIGLSEKERTLYRQIMTGFVFQFYNLVPNLTAKEER